MMPRFTWIAGLLLAASGLLVACGDNQDDAGSRDLLAEVEAQNYRDWARPKGWEGRTASRAPHGDAVDIYVNSVVDAVIQGDEVLSEWPLGSVIVKDGFRNESQVLTAVMEKREDGWYYAEYDEAGNADYSGHPSVCINCHSSGSDFVRAFELPR